MDAFIEEKWGQCPPRCDSLRVCCFDVWPRNGKGVQKSWLLLQVRRRECFSLETLKRHSLATQNRNCKIAGKNDGILDQSLVSSAKFMGGIFGVFIKDFGVFQCITSTKKWRVFSGFSENPPDFGRSL